MELRERERVRERKKTIIMYEHPIPIPPSGPLSKKEENKAANGEKIV